MPTICRFLFFFAPALSGLHAAARPRVANVMPVIYHSLYFSPARCSSLLFAQIDRSTPPTATPDPTPRRVGGAARVVRPTRGPRARSAAADRPLLLFSPSCTIYSRSRAAACAVALLQDREPPRTTRGLARRSVGGWCRWPLAGPGPRLKTSVDCRTALLRRGGQMALRLLRGRAARV